MQSQAQETLRTTEQIARQAIDSIPPDAWPIIDLLMKITTGVALVWLALALFAWWRRRAYNLTIAASASRNKKSRPGFLNVDHDAREAAIERGQDHADGLKEREAEEAARKAAGAAGSASRIGRFATLTMSLITLGTGMSGAIFNVTKMGEYVEEAGTVGRIEYVITTYPIGTAVVLFVIGYSIWRFVADKKWEKA